MKHFVIALTREEGVEIYGSLRSGSESIPAPGACPWQLLSDMRPDPKTPANERPKALLHVEGMGFVATCQIYTTYGETHHELAKRRTIQIRRMSLDPLENPVPVEDVSAQCGLASEELAQEMERGVLQIDQTIFDAVRRHDCDRATRLLGEQRLVAALPQHAEASHVGDAGLADGIPPAASPHSDSPTLRSQPYGARQAGQYARQQYLEAVSRCANPPRRWLGLAGATESAESFSRRIRSLDKAEEQYGAGARGEERVGYLLNQAGLGYYVFHDLEIKDRYGTVRRNVDHVVVGPGGVFVIETKNFSGSVLVSTPGKVKRSPDYRDAERDLTGALDQARQSAEFVESLLSLQHGFAIPLLCFYRGFVVGGGVIKGDHRRPAVHVISSGVLLNHVRAHKVRLDDSEAQNLADALRKREREGDC